MTSQTSIVGWRRAVAGAMASGVLAAGLMAGFGAGTASADVLDDIYATYATGQGGGQISNLVAVAMKLRAQGFRPSVGNMEDLQDGWNRRPNETPMIDALKATVSFQRRTQSRSSASSNPSNPNQQLPPGVNPGGIILGGPGVSSNLPVA